MCLLFKIEDNELLDFNELGYRTCWKIVKKELRSVFYSSYLWTPGVHVVDEPVVKRARGPLGRDYHEVWEGFHVFTDYPVGGCWLMNNDTVISLRCHKDDLLGYRPGLHEAAFRKVEFIV